MLRLASFSAAGIVPTMPIKLAFENEKLRKVCESPRSVDLRGILTHDLH